MKRIQALPAHLYTDTARGGLVGEEKLCQTIAIKGSIVKY